MWEVNWSSHENVHASQTIEGAEITNKQTEPARAAGKLQQYCEKKPWCQDYRSLGISSALGPVQTISMPLYQNSAPTRMLTTQTQKYWPKCGGGETEWTSEYCSWGCKLRMVDPQTWNYPVIQECILGGTEVGAWTWRNINSSIIHYSKGLAIQMSTGRQIYK